MADNYVYTVASLLLDCLNEQFPNTDLATPGQFCLRAGEEVSEDIDPIFGEDLCCTGLGWVRVGDTFPSSDFPAPDTVDSKCLPTSFAQQLEFGLLGCYHPGGQPQMASCPEHTQQAVNDMARLDILKRTVCCWAERVQQLRRGRGLLWTLQGIAISGPRGNCISRVGSILTQVPKCC